MTWIHVITAKLTDEQRRLLSYPGMRLPQGIDKLAAIDANGRARVWVPNPDVPQRHMIIPPAAYTVSERQAPEPVPTSDTPPPPPAEPARRSKWRRT